MARRYNACYYTRPVDVVKIIYSTRNARACYSSEGKTSGNVQPRLPDGRVDLPWCCSPRSLYGRRGGSEGKTWWQRGGGVEGVPTAGNRKSAKDLVPIYFCVTISMKLLEDVAAKNDSRPERTVLIHGTKKKNASDTSPWPAGRRERIDAAAGSRARLRGIPTCCSGREEKKLARRQAPVRAHAVVLRSAVITAGQTGLIVSLVKLL